MGLAFRTGGLVARIRRLILDQPRSIRILPLAAPPLFVTALTAGNGAARQHWASDQLDAAPQRLPMSQASLIVRLRSQRRGGAWYWSPAEDGGVYLYRYDQTHPYAHIPPAELHAQQADLARDGMGL
jgi:hypothetical protein